MSEFNPVTFDRWTRRSVEMEITPEMAEFFLSTMGRNRPISHEHVEKIRRDMEAGRFEDNGETIKFYKNGALSDGQHRLRACALSGKPFRSLVVFGLESTKNVDGGRKRNFGDFLAIEYGVKHGKTVSAALDHIWRWEIGAESITGGTPTAAEREAVLAKHPKIVECSAWIEAERRVFRDSGAAFVRYMAIEGSGAVGEDFFERVRSGANLDENDPAFLVRERLTKGGRHIAGTLLRKDDRDERINLMVVGFNMHVRGRRVTKIQLPKNGRRAPFHNEDALRLKWNCKIIRTEPTEDVE